MNGVPINKNAGAELARQSTHDVALLCLVSAEVVGVAAIRQRLGDRAAFELLAEKQRLIVECLSGFPDAREVRSSNSNHLFTFVKPSDAVRFALLLQERCERLSARAHQRLEDRVGIHVGEVLVQARSGAGAGSLDGMQVDICEAIRSLAEPGRILISRFACDSARHALKGQHLPGGRKLHWVSHGSYRMEGFEEDIEVCEVQHQGSRHRTPPTGTERVRPVSVAGDSPAALPGAPAPSAWRRAWQSPGTERSAALQGAALLTLAGWVALISGVADGVSFDLAYLFRKSGTPADVVIVAMDDPAYRDLHQDTSRVWDRGLHARLLDRLTKAGVRAVGFDILFDNPGAQELERPGYVEDLRDGALRAALERNGRVVLGAQLKEHAIQAPSPLFRRPGRWGIVEQARDSLTVIRRHVDGHQDVPPLAESLASITHPGHPARPSFTWLNYYGPPGTIRTLGYQSVLSPESVPDAVLSNRVVFVGSMATLPPARDAFPSPYSRWREASVHGVEVNATSYLNLVRRDWLVRLPVAGELGLVLVFGVALAGLSVFAVPRHSLAASGAVAAVFGLGCMLQQWVTHIWFPWVVVSAVQSPLAVAWSSAVWMRQMAGRGRETTAGQRSGRSSALALASHPPAPEPAAPPPVPAKGDSSDAATLVDGRTTTSLRVPMGDLATAIEPGGTMEGLTLKEEDKVPQVPDHEMIRCVGKGAYGEVWVARDIIGEFKAVKLIRRSAFSSQAPFDREFRGLQKFTPISRSHPGLVHILHIGRNDAGGFIYYIMEAGDDVRSGRRIREGDYVPRTLAADIELRGRLPLAEVVEYGIQIAEALAYLHAQELIHRDIKPANVLFVGGRAKLADIGLVTDIAVPGGEQTLVGTPGYMPPEGHGTPAADVFSLGRLLYVAATQRPARCYPQFDDDMVRGVDPDFLEGFEQTLRQACEPIVSERYPGAAPLAADLRKLQERFKNAARPHARTDIEQLSFDPGEIS